MAAGSTYTPIATYTIPSNTASYTFSSIPNTYTDIVIICSTKDTRAISGTADFSLRFNGDTGTNYSATILNGNGTAASSGRQTNGTAMANAQPGNNDSYGTVIFHIQNYANTTTYKTVISRANIVNESLRATVGLWRKTPEAITSITLIGEQGLAAGSTYTLYGITAA